MEDKKKLPERKKNSLDNYDYGSCGAYFVTICTLNRQNYFWGDIFSTTGVSASQLTRTTRCGRTQTSVGATIGRPLCTFSANNLTYNQQTVKLSRYGEIVNQAIKNIPSMYHSISVDSYVIMPNHVHMLLRVCTGDGGRPMVAPTVSRVVNQLKGYVSKQIGSAIWQKSFYDHIIRNCEDYEKHLKYIYENPTRWYYDELYSEQ